jgi:hypothetical protein
LHRLTITPIDVRNVARPFAISLLLVRTSSAADPFEIQIYDGTANPPGVFGLELHLNYVANGLREANAPEFPTNQVTHLTLEPSIGLTSWWELGAYLQSAVRADGHFDYAGVKFRSKFVTTRSFHEHVRLGVNFELSLLPETYDADRWGAEIRPIAAWEDTGWLFAVNPILGVPLAGSGFAAGPTLEPALGALRKIGRVGGFGIEYYSSLGPIGGLAPVRDQQHYIYEVFDLLAIERLELNLGIGQGLTATSNPLVLKMIIGWSFEPARLERVVGPPPPCSAGEGADDVH